MKSEVLLTQRCILRLYVAPTIWVNPAQFETSLLGGSDLKQMLHTTKDDQYAEEDGRSDLWTGFDEDETSDDE